MKRRGPVILLVVVMVLIAGASFVLAIEGRERETRQQNGKELQHVIGGLGFGPAVDLSRCSFAFDLRVAGRCPHAYGPILCGNYFCPEHGLSVFQYPALSLKEELVTGASP